MDETVDQSTGPHPWEREAAAGELELPDPGPRPKNVVALADAPVIMDGTVQILGATAGSVRTGLNTFIQSPETKYVPHCHSASESFITSALAFTRSIARRRASSSCARSSFALRTSSAVATRFAFLVVPAAP